MWCWGSEAKSVDSGNEAGRHGSNEGSPALNAVAIASDGRLERSNTHQQMTSYTRNLAVPRRRCLMPRDDGGSAQADEVLLNDLLSRVIAAFNAHDAAAFTAMMTEDVVFEHSAAPATMHGRAEVKDFYTNSLLESRPRPHPGAGRWAVLPRAHAPSQPPVARSGHSHRTTRSTGPSSHWQARRVRRPGDRRLPRRIGQPGQSGGRYGRRDAATRCPAQGGQSHRESDGHCAAVADEIAPNPLTPSARCDDGRLGLATAHPATA